MYRLFYVSILMILMACSSGKTVQTEPQITKISDAPLAYMPKAIVYRMNGDYVNNVAVLMNDNRSSIVGYPAISDVSVKSVPISVGNGWYLSRAGMISQNTAFLKYTYQEYSQLPQQPSASDLMSQIISDARVVDIKTLDMTTSEAINNIDAIKEQFK